MFGAGNAGVDVCHLSINRCFDAARQVNSQSCKLLDVLIGQDGTLAVLIRGEYAVTTSGKVANLAADMAGVRKIKNLNLIQCRRNRTDSAGRAEDAEQPGEFFWFCDDMTNRLIHLLQRVTNNVVYLIEFHGALTVTDFQKMVYNVLDCIGKAGGA